VKKWVSGICLLGIYHGCLHVSSWLGDELFSIIGKPEGQVNEYAIFFTGCAWVAFGFIARAFFWAIRWD
jgi:hypothetical protein